MHGEEVVQGNAIDMFTSIPALCRLSLFNKSSLRLPSHKDFYTSHSKTQVMRSSGTIVDEVRETKFLGLLRPCTHATASCGRCTHGVSMRTRGNHTKCDVTGNRFSFSQVLV